MVISYKYEFNIVYLLGFSWLSTIWMMKVDKMYMKKYNLNNVPSSFVESVYWNIFSCLSPIFFKFCIIMFVRSIYSLIDLVWQITTRILW